MLRKLLGIGPRLTGHRDLRPYDQCWDIALNAAMDRFPIIAGQYTAEIGPFEVWVNNYPYSYGYRRQYDHPESGLPSLTTRARLQCLIQDAACSSYMDEVEKYRP